MTSMNHNQKEPKLPGLSKSRYCTGLQCHKLLYTRVHEPKKIPEPDAFTQYLFDQGTEAGLLATKLFLGGIDIPAFPIDESIQKTLAALGNEAEHIFEAAFNFENIHVKVDVLRNLGNNIFDIIEVKSGTSVKDVHLDDLAIQKYVLAGNGMEVNSTILMHMNKEYRHPVGELFVLSDQTEKVEKRMPQVPENLEKMRQMLGQDKPPESRIGPQCKKPYECALMKQCWQHIPDMSIFNVPNLRNGKWDYYNQGIIRLEDLPESFIGTPGQMPFINSFRSGGPVIDQNGLNNFMGELEEPIYFMDFETIQLAAPKYPGTKPWQQHTIQWSVHVLKNGELQHHEFIHDSDEDPREPFIQSLLDVLGNSGSIVVYSAPFEGGRLKEIAEAFPQYQAKIDNVLERLWDQLAVFKKFYCDSKFKGSNSIKNILPVLVPNLSYLDLEVQEGGAAMVEYAQMINLPDGAEKETIKNNLLEYCKLDTLAMVEIHKVLKNLL